MSSEDQELSIKEIESPQIIEPVETVEDSSLSNISTFELEKKAHLFNQFYFDLLKKLKTNAKQNKEKSKEARNILRAIKNSYSSYETGSVEYISKLPLSISNDFWNAYYECQVDTIDKFLLSEPAFNAYLYNQISIDMIAVCLNDTFVLHHYLTIFAILLQDITEEDATQAMTILKNLKTKDITKDFENIKNKDVEKWITHLYNIYSSKLSNVFGNHLTDIENTSLGKMAKEIIDEVDLTKIQDSITNNGDVLKALTDPDSGIANLLGTVSQKMITKLASGEIKQENLLEDAMKFASKLPGLMPGGSGGMDFGKMASMMQNMLGSMGNQDDDDSSMNMGSLMSMMQGMMGGSSTKAKRSMANNPSSSAAYSAAKSLSTSSRKSEQLKKMKEKIKKRAAKENNISDQIE